LNDHNILEAQLDRSKYRQVIYVETPANPTLDCIDIAAVCKMAREYHALVVIDNTFATPYLQRPLTLGADYVIHSTTKYLNGHGNGIGGVIIGRTDETHWDKIWANMKLMGTNCNAFDAWLVHNGLKTLTLRMDRQCENALMVARYLGSHQKVRKVNYPGLEDFHHHHLAQKQMSQYGAMLSFEVDGGREKAIQTIDALKLAKIAPTLGDVDTLVLHPATSSHLNVDRALKEQFGITEGLIRMSIGIESVEDLKEDLNQALK
jgi:methionine-gamma-lyase